MLGVGITPDHLLCYYKQWQINRPPEQASFEKLIGLAPHSTASEDYLRGVLSQYVVTGNGQMDEPPEQASFDELVGLSPHSTAFQDRPEVLHCRLLLQAMGR